MNLPELIQKYGYAAVLLGTFFEGETLLIMAGFAAHGGRLSLPWVILARPGVERAGSLLRRFQAPLLLGFRFVYGIRVATPIAALLRERDWGVMLLVALLVGLRLFLVLLVPGWLLWLIVRRVDRAWHSRKR